MRQWENSSAYFNGDRVLVELLAYPGTGPNRVVVDLVVAGSPASSGEGAAAASICGSDDRVTSGDARAGRFRYRTVSGTQCFGEVWCSAFLPDGSRFRWPVASKHWKVTCGGTP
jgi:hypothetical protein